jgi:hypothetical protein
VLADLKKRWRGGGGARYIGDQGHARGVGSQVRLAARAGSRTRAWLRLEVQPELGDDVRGPSVGVTRWEVLVGCPRPQRRTRLQSGGARVTR